MKYIKNEHSEDLTLMNHEVNDGCGQFHMQLLLINSTSYFNSMMIFLFLDITPLKFEIIINILPTNLPESIFSTASTTEILTKCFHI